MTPCLVTVGGRSQHRAQNFQHDIDRKKSKHSDSDIHANIARQTARYENVFLVYSRGICLATPSCGAIWSRRRGGFRKES